MPNESQWRNVWMMAEASFTIELIGRPTPEDLDDIEQVLVIYMRTLRRAALLKANPQRTQEQKDNAE